MERGQLAYAFRRPLLTAFNRRPAVVVTASPGSGLRTQLAPYIARHDDLASAASNRVLVIFTTLLAATAQASANRVALQRDTEVGTADVGFAVPGVPDAWCSATRILYTTHAHLVYMLEELVPGGSSSTHGSDVPTPAEVAGSWGEDECKGSVADGGEKAAEATMQATLQRSALIGKRGLVVAVDAADDGHIDTQLLLAVLKSRQASASNFPGVPGIRVMLLSNSSRRGRQLVEYVAAVLWLCVSWDDCARLFDSRCGCAVIRYWGNDTEHVTIPGYYRYPVRVLYEPTPPTDPVSACVETLMQV